MKANVATDKLIRFLAKHPRVGAEPVTRAVVQAAERAGPGAETRPLVWLQSLLTDFGKALCSNAQLVGSVLRILGSLLEATHEQPQFPTEKSQGKPLKRPLTASLRYQISGVLSQL